MGSEYIFTSLIIIYEITEEVIATQNYYGFVWPMLEFNAHIPPGALNLLSEGIVHLPK